MMGACGYFIMTDGFWSYPGFVASEVVTLSTIMTMLLLIDAISAIKCKTVGKRKTNKAIRVATGADYESDEDEMNLKKQIVRADRTVKTNRAKGKQADDFGADDSEYGSEVDSVMELQKGGTTRGMLNKTGRSHRVRKGRDQDELHTSRGGEDDRMSRGEGRTSRGGDVRTSRGGMLRLDSE